MNNTNLDVNAINGLMSGRNAIKVGIDPETIALLCVGIFAAVLLGCIIAKAITNKMTK